MKLKFEHQARKITDMKRKAIEFERTSFEDGRPQS